MRVLVFVVVLAVITVIGYVRLMLVRLNVLDVGVVLVVVGGSYGARFRFFGVSRRLCWL